MLSGSATRAGIIQRLGTALAALLATVIALSDASAAEAGFRIVPERIQVQPDHAMVFVAVAQGPGIGLVNQVRWSATGGSIVGTGPVARFVAGPFTGVFQVVARKGNGGPEATAMVKIGYAPTAGAVTVATTSGTPVPVVLRGADRDGDPLTYSILLQPRNGTLTGIAPDLVYTPRHDFSGTDPFIYTVSDGWGFAFPALVTIQVAALGVEPVITSAAAATATVGQPFTYAITATNGPTGFAATGLPPGLGVDPGTGIITGIPSTAGGYDIELSASNDAGTGKAALALAVAKGTPAIVWNAPADVTYGTALIGDQLSATADVPGSFAYSPALGSVLEVGTHTLAVDFTPSDLANYHSASATVALTVTKAIPALVWPPIADIFYGTPLSALQLGATAPIPGTWTFNHSVGAVLAAGTHTLSATFEPTDSAHFATASISSSVNVARATPTVTWTAPEGITYGAMLSDVQLAAVASVPGTFTYDPAAGTVLPAGSHTLTANFAPLDALNHQNASATVTIAVAKAVPTITWPVPAPIDLGTALADAQLNASASVPGAFVYTPAVGTVLGSGARVLNVAFTPDDGANYLGASASVTLHVVDRPPTVAEAPTVTPSPVTGTTATVAVLGADDAGEANLSYAWSATGPADVTFSPNDSHEARDAAATFTAAGAYTFTVTISDAGARSVAADRPVTVAATPTVLTVLPATAAIATGAGITLTAVVKDQFNNAIAGAAPTWTATGAANVVGAGLTAEATGAATAGVATVVATLGALSDSSQLTVTSPDGAVVVTIVADPAVTFERAASAARIPAVLTVSRTGPVDQTLEVGYGVDGTATPGTDYATLSGLLTIPAGASTQVIEVDAGDDLLAEPDESVVVALASGPGYVIGAPAAATATIRSPDRPAVAFTSAAGSAREDIGTAKVQVKLSKASTAETRVSFAVAAGTATPVADFTARTGVLVIPAGQTAGEITVAVVNDTIVDPAETVIVTLSSPIGLDLGAIATHTLTLRDSRPVRVRVDALAAEVAENSAGTALRFSRTGEVDAALALQLTWYGTAVAGTDYVGTRPATITIPAGSLTVDIPIVPIDDTVIGSDLTVQVYLGVTVPGVVIEQYSAQLYLLDDEAPLLSVRLQPATLAEGATTYLYVGLKNEGGQLVSRRTSRSIAWQIAGTGINAADFIGPIAGTFSTYADSPYEMSIYLQPKADDVEEGVETFTVNATMGSTTGQASGTIQDIATVTMSPNAATLAENATAPAIARFTRSGTSTPLTIQLYWSSAATAVVDFAGTLPPTITFGAGQNVVDVPIAAIDDAIIESDELISCYAYNAAGYLITGPNIIAITLLDDEAPILAVRIDPANLYEGTSSYAYIGMRNAAAQPVSRSTARTITWQVTGPSATDFTTALSGTTTTYANSTYDAYVILSAANDGVEDGPEAFTVTATMGTITGQASGQLLDRPVLSVAGTPASVAESTATGIDVVITRIGSLNQPTVVQLYWSSQATAGQDFTGTLPTTVTIEAGQTSVTIPIDPIDDAIIESDETISVTIGSSPAYTTSQYFANLLILDDEAPLLVAGIDYGINAEGRTANPNVRLANALGVTVNRATPTTVSYAVTGVAAADVGVALTGTVIIPANAFEPAQRALPLVSDAIAEGVESATVTFTTATASAGVGLDIVETAAIRFQPATVSVQEPGSGQPLRRVTGTLTPGWTVPAEWEAAVVLVANTSGNATWGTFQANRDLAMANGFNAFAPVVGGSFTFQIADVNADDAYEGGPGGSPETAFADLSMVQFRQGSRLSPQLSMNVIKAFAIDIQDKVHATITFQAPTPGQATAGDTVDVAFTVSADQPLQEVRVNGTVIASGTVTPGPMTARVTLPHLGTNSIRAWVFTAQGAVVQQSVLVAVLPATIPVFFVSPEPDAVGIGVLRGAPVARAYAETGGETGVTATATIEAEGLPGAAVPATATWDGQYIDVDFGQRVPGRWVLRVAVVAGGGSRTGGATIVIDYDAQGWTPTPVNDPIVIQHPLNGSTITAFGGQ